MAIASTLPRPTAASQCSLSVPSPGRYPDDVDELLLEVGLLSEEDSVLEEVGLLLNELEEPDESSLDSG